MPDTAIAGLTPLAAANYAADDLLVIDDTSAVATKSTRADNAIDGLLRVASDALLLRSGTSGTKLVVAQPGGTPGTDEVQIYHDGTDAYYETKSGTNKFKNNGSSNVIGLYCGTDEARVYVDGGYYLRFITSGYVQVSVNSTTFGPYDGSVILNVATDGLLKFDKTANWAREATLCCKPVSPAQITANQPAYAGLTGRHNRLSSDASRDIQGIAVGADGEERYITNVGANNIVIKNDSASATAAGNKILTHTGADITLAAQGAIALWYDGTSSRWRTY